MVTLNSHRYVPNTLTFLLQKMWNKLVSYSSSNFYCLIHNPRLFLVRKFARFEVIREGLFWIDQSMKATPKVDANPSIVATEYTVDDIISDIEQYGYFAGLQLSEAIVQDILNYAQASKCQGDRNPELTFPYSQKEAIEATLSKKFICCSYPNPIDNCAAIKQLIQDKTIQAIATRYLKVQPQYIGSELVWSYPIPTTQSEKIDMAQVFHYDLDDVRSLKLFFYLTEVDTNSGAHVCIQGTHWGKKLIHQLLGQRCAGIADEKIVRDYGTDNVVTFCGKPGFGFVEDPCCFHKGSPPISQARLLLQFQFVVNPYKNIRTFQA